jgi:hypothetical protein
MSDRTVVWIKWADAHTSHGGWLDINAYEDDGETIVDTVGFLISPPDGGAKKDHITVWQTLCDDEAIHAMHIPMGMVRSMVVLNPPL